MNSKNISTLAEILINIGFDGSVGEKLVQHICFKPSSFVLTERLSRGKDQLSCSIFFERNTEEYSCNYYDVALFKESELPDLTIQSIQVRELDKRMAIIEWSVLNYDDFNFVNEDSWQREYEIEKVVTDISRLSITDEGRHLADYLKVKHWSGLSFPLVGENINVLRSKFEVSQRFYFFDGKGISVDEAYRFLLNRWLEKKLNARKKSGVPDASETNEADSSSGDKSLLQKKRKRKSQKIK